MFSMMHMVVYEVMLLVGGVVGYYFGKQGMSSLSTDMANVKADIVALKDKLMGTSTAPSVPVSTGS